MLKLSGPSLLLEITRGSSVNKIWRYNMRFTVRIILLSYHRLYLVACPHPSVLLPFVGGGDLVRSSSVYWSGGGFNTPSQVDRYLVAGVLAGVGCGD